MERIKVDGEMVLLWLQNDHVQTTNLASANRVEFHLRVPTCIHKVISTCLDGLGYHIIYNTMD